MDMTKYIKLTGVGGTTNKQRSTNRDQQTEISKQRSKRDQRMSVDLDI